MKPINHISAFQAFLAPCHLDFTSVPSCDAQKDRRMRGSSGAEAQMGGLNAEIQELSEIVRETMPPCSGPHASVPPQSQIPRLGTCIWLFWGSTLGMRWTSFRDTFRTLGSSPQHLFRIPAQGLSTFWIQKSPGLAAAVLLPTPCKAGASLMVSMDLDCHGDLPLRVSGILFLSPPPILRVLRTLVSLECLNPWDSEGEPKLQSPCGPGRTWVAK
jgi:hypothetical protein